MPPKRIASIGYLTKLHAERGGRASKKALPHCKVWCTLAKTRGELDAMRAKFGLRVRPSGNLDTYRHQVFFKMLEHFSITPSTIPSRRAFDYLIPCFPGPVLFIGWAPSYTAHYTQMCAMTTVDYNPATKPDIVADVTDRRLPGRIGKTYKSVIMNGVISWGVNTPAQIDAALRNCAALLRKGGIVFIGWNKVVRAADSEMARDARYATADILKAMSSYFADVRHVYGASDYWKQQYAVGVKK